jgi:exopolyphosphatase/guanosine-5'-triphosphate,3'-diphosphate pyrophosphatase
MEEGVLRFAAVDVGSNAVRLLLSRVLYAHEHPVHKKESLVRMPLRLGEDVFTAGAISPAKEQSLIRTLQGFARLIEAYGARDYLACATSALREAANGIEVADAVHKASGIRLEILDGSREAEIICLAKPESWLNVDEQYLFVDVGGGSTEISAFAGGRRVASRSFEIGALRILKGRVAESHWRDMKLWLKAKTAEHRPLVAVGSGGNINKLFRLARKREGARLSYDELRRLHGYLEQFSYAERITRLGLGPDRADVIVPASEIYLSVMKWARCREMLVPLAGLSDGLIQILYAQFCDAKLPKRHGSASEEGTPLSLRGVS